MTVEAGAVAGWLRGMLLGASCLLVAAATLRSQDLSQGFTARFPIGEDPQGRVLDSQGQAILGARIGVVCVGSPNGYLQALRGAMLRLPLLPAISGRDGSYVLSVTKLHALVYGAGPGEFILRASRQGYEAWQETMSGGLYAYLGSDIVLSSLPALPSLAVQVVDPEPGMIFAVENSAMGSRAEHHAIGDDGALILHLALLPYPASGVADGLVRPWFRRGQLLFPGRSTLSGSIPPSAETLHWQADPALTLAPQRLVDGDGKALASVWGIYESSTGRRLRFEFSGSQLPRDAALDLRYVGAKGLISQQVGAAEVLSLQPAPEHSAPLMISVRDPDGVSIRQCTATLWTLMDATWSGGAGMPRPLLEIVGTEGGYLILPQRVLGVPALLEVRAPGYAAATLLEPRSWRDGQTIDLQPLSGGRLSFDLSTETGEPIPGAVLFLSDRAYAAGGMPFGLLTSDVHGRIDLGRMQPGTYRYRWVADGRLPFVGRVLVVSGEDSRVSIELPAAKSLRLRTQDQRGRPLPFARIELNQTLDSETLRLGSYRSDSRGRLWVRGLAAESILEVNQTLLFGNSPSQPFTLERDREAICKVFATRAVLLLVPDSSRVTYKGRSANASALLLSWSGRASGELVIGIDRGPPARALSRELQRVPQGRVQILDRSMVVRRQRLKLPGVEAADLQHLRINPIPLEGGRSTLGKLTGQMVEVDADGQAWYVARDLGPYRCQVMHPGYLLREFTIPSSEVSAEDISIRLVQGTQLSFRGRLSQEMLAGGTFVLIVHAVGRGLPLMFTDFWHPLAGSQEGDPVLIRCPVALLPGEYEVDLQFGSRRLRSTVLMLPKVGVVLELGNN